MNNSQKNSFKIRDKNFIYYLNDYDRIKQPSERIVEIPLAFYYYNFFCTDNNFMEIGAVTPYYIENIKHDVYDVMDSYSNCNRTDLSKVDFDFSNKHLLSISTFEHIGIGDYNQSVDINSALNLITKIVINAKSFLITFPYGYNHILDNYVLNKLENVIILKRTNVCEWKESDKKSLDGIGYGHPYRCGNALLIVSNLKF